ncbi:MAG TPA: MFS transporter [Baekduia sp.]|nr:MFS transporter [Baekduia sp.]
MLQRAIPSDPLLRRLALAGVVNAAGTGLLLSTLVLYFTQDVGLSGGQVAAGMSAGGAIGLLAGVPLGHLADTRGAREVLVALLALESLATLAYLAAHSFVTFVAAACAAIALSRGAMAVSGGVTARRLPPEGRVRSRAFLRAMTNVGFALGAGLATIGLAIGTRGAYQAMIAADAASFLVVAAMHARLPHLPRVPPDPAGPRLVVLRDRPYVVVMALMALMTMHNSMLDVGLPLWVSAHTDAPPALVGVIFVMNCVSVALLSVRFAAGSEAVPDAARAAFRAGITLLVACTLLAVSGPLPAVAAAAVLIVGMLVQSAGEMQEAAAQWGLSMGLAPADRHGQYQGLASTGLALGWMLGPPLMAGVVAVGTAGWLAVGIAFTAIGAMTVPAARWALATRAAAPAAVAEPA